VSRGVTPVTASCPVEASDIRAGIDESGSAEMPLVKSTRVRQRSSAELRRPKARGTAFGTPVGPGDTKCPRNPRGVPDAPVTWAVAAIVIPILGGTYGNQGGNRAPTHAGQRKISPALSEPGFVLMFENTSHQPLTLVARLEHPAVRDMKKVGLYLGPKSHVDVTRSVAGSRSPGDRITLENAISRLGAARSRRGPWARV